MMLTTNRYLAIDPAFESRIDLSFVFQDLEPASRAKVWYNFLDDVAHCRDSDHIAHSRKAPCGTLPDDREFASQCKMDEREQFVELWIETGVECRNNGVEDAQGVDHILAVPLVDSRIHLVRCS